MDRIGWFGLPVLVLSAGGCQDDCNDHVGSMAVTSVEFQAYVKANSCDWRSATAGLSASRDKCPTDSQAKEFFQRCRSVLLSDYGKDDRVNYARLLEYNAATDECVYEQSVTECTAAD